MMELGTDMGEFGVESQRGWEVQQTLSQRP